jgi:hypothetical protein
MVSVLTKHRPDDEIIFGITIFCHSGCGERLHPNIWKAMSDFRVFYGMDTPASSILTEIREKYLSTGTGQFRIASHGLVHLDHRLLPKSTQELSILLSCSILDAKVFIPPRNMWNADTESVCLQGGIELMKFEDGWRHVMYNEYKPGGRYYLHPFDCGPEYLERWLLA